ncbi:hypothetical protein ACH5RR_039817 [Cinchona calisaya]|uniref:Calcineurin B-like protein n=1 Tax=Cinchona calisaya TaxID=153742 RepID=A0ABD2Y2W2_9GENT
MEIFLGNINKVKKMVIAILMESEMRLSDDLLDQIIDKVVFILRQTFADADADRDGKINKEEWKDFVMWHPSLLRNMTVPYLKETSTRHPPVLFSTHRLKTDICARRVSLTG